VFELTPEADGHWARKSLHVFSDKAGDGACPCSGLIFDAAGNLYGTTSAGGVDAWGTLFEIIH
jgi:hypothetical protein